MKFNYWIVAVLFIFMISCSEVFELDISDKEITVVAPNDSLQTSINQVVFWWDAVEHATKYHLQVVSPSFDNVIQLPLDTVVNGLKFTFPLSTGTYQWRIRAENSSTQTAYVTRDLFVIVSDTLDNQTVVLKNPADDHHTNNQSVRLEWFGIATAQDYRIDITDTLGNAVLPSEIITSTEKTLVLDEGIYIWKVKANNNNSSTAFSSRKITVDTTSPNPAVLVSPINNSTTDSSNSVTLEWTSDVTSLSPIQDELYLYTDSLVNVFNTYSQVSSPYNVSGLSGNTTYWWRVRSTDKAGNTAEFSNPRKFTTK